VGVGEGSAGVTKDTSRKGETSRTRTAAQTMTGGRSGKWGGGGWGGGGKCTILWSHPAHRSGTDTHTKCPK
jgi:hypothetical protein